MNYRSGIIFLVTVLFVVTVSGQGSRWLVATGEYRCYLLDNKTHQLYSMTSGLPQLVEGIPGNIRTVSAGAHHALAVDGEGAVWAWGTNMDGECGTGRLGDDVERPRRIEQDSLGRPFRDVIAVVGGGGDGGWGSAALKADGTVWVWGNTRHGIRGDGHVGGANPLPVQVMFPKGTVIVKILVYEIGIALDATGKVWTWGSQGLYGEPYLLARGVQQVDASRPGIVPLPGPAKDIAGGRKWNYALLKDNSLYGWGMWTSYLGLGDKGYKNQPDPQLRPQRLDGILKLPKPVASIYTNTMATYAILTDSTLWGWGDNSMGAVGTGEELDYAHFKHGDGTPAPYAWDWSPGLLMVQKPVALARGLHSFTRVWVENSLTFYAYAEDVHGQLYSWGRNKGCVLGNGVMESDREMGQLGSEYPNSWDVTLVTPIDPIGLKKVFRATSPHCMDHPESKACNLYRKPEGFEPKAIAAARQTGKGEWMLDGSGSHDNVQDDARGIIQYRWKQVSGPGQATIVLPSMATPKVITNVNGEYIFRLVVTDNGWKKDSTTVTVKAGGS